MSPDLKMVLDELRRANLPTFLDVELTSPNVKGNSFGDTPLHVIATWGDTKSARILVNEGAAIDARGEDSFTPLHNAVEQGKIEMVRLLIECGANPNLTTDFGDDAFELAKLLERAAILALLKNETS